MPAPDPTPSPAAVSPRVQRRKARTATAILDAAEVLFLGHGYAVTTMEDLAEEADVAIGSIYAHFVSKAGVYEALIERAIALHKRYCDEGFATGLTPVERLVGVAEGHLRFAREHPGSYLLSRFPPPDQAGEDAAPSVAARVAERIKDETGRMAGELRDVQEQDLLGRPVDPHTAATFLWAAWDGVIACNLGPGSMGLSESEFDAVIQFARESLALGFLASPASVQLS